MQKKNLRFSKALKLLNIMSVLKQLEILEPFVLQNFRGAQLAIAMAFQVQRVSWSGIYGWEDTP